MKKYYRWFYSVLVLSICWINSQSWGLIAVPKPQLVSPLRMDLILHAEINKIFYAPILRQCELINVPLYPRTEEERKKIIEALKPLRATLTQAFKDILSNQSYTFRVHQIVAPTHPDYALYQQSLHLRGMEEYFLEFVLDRSHWKGRVLYLDVDDPAEEKDYGRLRMTLYDQLRLNVNDQTPLSPEWVSKLRLLLKSWRRVFSPAELDLVIDHYPQLNVLELHRLEKDPEWMIDILSNLTAFKCVQENDKLCLLSALDRYGWENPENSKIPVSKLETLLGL